jgi:hypothetical protein
MRETCRNLCAVWLASLPGLGMAWGVAIGLAAGKPSVADSRPYGIEQRIPLRTVREERSPDPPLLCRSVPAFPNRKFSPPLYVLAEPDSDRFLVVEQKGTIQAFAHRRSVEQADLFPELPNRDTCGVTFHPGYSGDRFVYIFSNGLSSEKRKRNRISWFTVSETSPRHCLPESEVVVLEWESNRHNGGDLGAGDIGRGLWEMIPLVRRGDNFDWRVDSAIAGGKLRMDGTAAGILEICISVMSGYVWQENAPSRRRNSTTCRSPPNFAGFILNFGQAG